MTTPKIIRRRALRMCLWWPIKAMRTKGCTWKTHVRMYMTWINIKQKKISDC